MSFFTVIVLLFIAFAKVRGIYDGLSGHPSKQPTEQRTHQPSLEVVGNIIYTFNGNAVNTGNLWSKAQKFGDPEFPPYPPPGSPYTRTVSFNNGESRSKTTSYYTANTASRNAPLSVAVWLGTPFYDSYTPFSLSDDKFINPAIRVDLPSSGHVQVVMALRSNWSVILDYTGLPPSEWFHVAVTVSETYSANLYINGAVVATVPGSDPFPSTSVTSMVFGASGSGADDIKYQGSMSGFGLYYTELNADEIQSLYTFKSV